ncbi:MAG: tetratricopeptide repeat protein, partial [Armatimonadetes bacterium]|nr:tetratricopeptide repeat protein [Armatimonadota bacterium]
MPTLTPLTIRMFGALELYRGDSPVVLPRVRNAIWLLALLLLQAGQARTREWLADALWPEGDADHSGTNLRQRLADLRRSLGPDGERLQSPDRRSLAFDLRNCQVDFQEFDHAVALSGRGGSLRAVELYRGPLLEGCFEPWILAPRAEREAAYLRSLQQLAAYADADGDPSAAIGWLQRARAADPLGEPHVRRLIERLAQNGQTQAALEEYHSLRRALWEQHQARPDPNTEALFRQLHSRSGVPVKSPRRPTPCALSVPLVGREADLALLAEQVAAHRLVTVTGPGGVGKTTLVREFASRRAPEFPDGLFWLELASLEPAALPGALARALELPEEEKECRPPAGWGGAPALPDRVRDHLAGREILIVLDNCEHLLPHCRRLVESILPAAPRLRLLATSREALGLPGEGVLSLRPLAPDEAVALLQFHARRLGIPNERLGPDGAEMRELCRRLDGLPLGLELAAGLLDTLTVGEIRRRWDAGYGAADLRDETRFRRHQSLHAAVAWSYDLLSQAQRQLFRSLAVFVGGFDLPAAEAVAGVEDPFTIQTLVRKSLVATENQNGGTRYRLLEVLRAFAIVRLREEGELDALRGRHLAFYRRRAEELESALRGAEQQQALAELDREASNYAAALSWACTLSPLPGPQPAIEALRLACALGQFWRIRGEFSTGRALLDAALSTLERAGVQAPGLRAWAQGWAGYLALYQGDYPAAEAYCAGSLAAFRELGDEEGIAEVTGCLAVARKDQGRAEEARQLFQESLDLWRRLNGRAGMASCLGYLGILAQEALCLNEAADYFAESLQLRRGVGDTWGVAAVLNNQGLLAVEQGDLARAEPLLQESLALRRTLGDRRAQAITLNKLGEIALRRGDPERAAELTRE